MLTDQQLAAITRNYSALHQPLLLFHGTSDPKFFSKLCLKSGFGSDLLFKSTYSLQALGGTAVYGPGLYLASNINESRTYGNLIVKFEVDTTTDYLDLSGPAGSRVVRDSGVARMHILNEPRIHALIKVTREYYVLRTPYNVIVSAHID